MFFRSTGNSWSRCRWQVVSCASENRPLSAPESMTIASCRMPVWRLSSSTTLRPSSLDLGLIRSLLGSQRARRLSARGCIPGWPLASSGSPPRNCSTNLHPYPSCGAAMARASDFLLMIQRLSRWNRYWPVARAVVSAPPPDGAVVASIRWLARHAHATVEELSQWIGLSHRQLRRRFSVAVGYGPKMFQSVCAFNDSLISQTDPLARPLSRIWPHLPDMPTRRT